MSSYTLYHLIIGKSSKPTLFLGYPKRKLLNTFFLSYNMDIMLYQNERLDYLECKDLQIIQDKSGYTFTTDAVLLANYIKAYAQERLLDFGSGSGVIPILCSAKTTAKELVGLELQQRLADMATRSVRLNNLSPRVKIVQGDIKDAPTLFGAGTFDVVTSNPPYRTFEGDKNGVSEETICRREVYITIDELMESAGKVLKYGGRMYCVYKAERLTDLLVAMRSHGIEPKSLTMMQPKASKPPDTVIVEGKKGAKAGILIKKPLVIYDETGVYTPQAKKIYGK